MAITALSSNEVEAALDTLQGWALVDGKLRRDFTFSDFSQAWGFMNRVALCAEKTDHHPEWSNVYNRVTIELVTHEASGITERDTTMAAAINKILAKSL